MMRKIIIVGGGYAGFYTAWRLEKKLRHGEAQVTVIDPRSYMTYQPFLPEVLAGSIEPRHATVPLRSHLRRTEVVSGTVTSISHANKFVTVHPAAGSEFTLHYDMLVVTAGAVTRAFPIADAGGHTVALKRIEDAIAIRNRIVAAFDQASNLPPGPERKRLLTITFVGGGFAGVEGFGELLSLAAALLRFYPKLSLSELDIRLVEAHNRILPEVTESIAAKVARSLEQRGARICLNTRILSAANGHVVLSNGDEFESNLTVWTAGNAANPMVAAHSDLPVDDRGYLIVRPDLRIGTATDPVPDAWAAGDNAAILDLSGNAPGLRTAPTAQHAVRQGKLLAANLIASLRGKAVKNYVHKNLGVVATLGIGKGVFESGPIAITGLLAWLIHRGYHVLAIPTWERKIRVLAVWMTALFFGRDIATVPPPAQRHATRPNPEESASPFPALASSAR